MHRLLSVALFCLLALGCSITTSPRGSRLGVLWSFEGKELQALVAGDKIVVLDRDRLVSLDVSTGETEWETKIDPTDEYEKPWVTTDDIALIARDKTLYKVRLSDGEMVGEMGFQLSEHHEVFKVLGPPEVVATRHRGKGELIGLDWATQGERGRIQFPGVITEIVPIDDVLVVSWFTDHSYEFSGVDPKSMEEIWKIRFGGLTRLHSDHGHLLIETTIRSADIAYPLDARTGELGEPYPSRAPTLGWDSEDSWLLQTSHVRDDDKTGIRRNELETGQPVWEVTIPGSYWLPLRAGNDLFIHVEPDYGRGSLLRLDWRTGEVLDQTRGLQNVDQLLRAGDFIVAVADELRVVAFSTASASEGEIGGVAEEAVRILSVLERVDYFEVWDYVLELQSLGSEALPVVVERIPELESQSLGAIALLLAESQHENGAAALAKRLEENIPPQHQYALDPSEVILFALSMIGGPAEVDEIAGVLTDEGRSSEQRMAAWTALASINSPAAQELILSRLAEEHPQKAWWDAERGQTDSDQDGVPDAVEEWFALDSRESDSDQDGIVDGLDPAPNAKKQVPETVEEEIALAVFRQFYMFKDGDPRADRLIIVTGDAALEWRGPSGPTLSFTPEQAQGFLERTVLTGVAQVSFHFGEIEFAEPAPVIHDGEVACSLTIYRGPLNAEGYSVIVRKIGEEWVIRLVRQEWIS